MSHDDTHGELKRLLDACNEACFTGEDHQEPAFLCDGGKSSLNLTEFMLANYARFVRPSIAAPTPEMIEAGRLAIMGMLEPKRTPKPKPTIAELEAILNSENPPQFTIGPDGEMTELSPRTTTASEVAATAYKAMVALAPSATPPTTGAIAEIAAERQRQIEKEGWTAEHDNEHPAGSLSLAAMCYAQNAAGQLGKPYSPVRGVPAFWPWEAEWWKPKNPRRDLIRAAALIAAELDRMAAMDGTTKGGG